MAVVLNEALVEKEIKTKIRRVAIVISICFLFIFFRLYYLQILKGSLYSQQSVNNRIRLSSIPAPRGIMRAKTGEVLVGNKPSFDLILIPQDTPKVSETLDALAALLNLPREALQKRYEKQKGRPPFEPVTLKKDLSWDNMSLILAKKPELQGVSIDVVPTRSYASNIFAPHVFGFVGEIDRTELDRYAPEGYRMGDCIGKFGLEKWGEQYLRGVNGGLQSEVDAYGNRTKILAEVNPVAGRTITLSLVPRVQSIAETLVRDHPGAIVALEPYTGEVLAMASSPCFDPRLFARGIDAQEWLRLTNHPEHPLLNRAIQSQQPPGSVFKIITAIAALEEKVIDPSFTVFCPGYLNLGSRTFNCWKKHGHGYVNLHDAIVQSCDTYFYTLGMKLGVDTIHKYATMLGLGEKTGIELEGERPGLIPTQEWKKRRYGYPWQKGETLTVAIGQGFVLCTPLQLAAMTAAIANGSYVPRPHLVLSVDAGTPRFEPKPEKNKNITLSPKTLTIIKKALCGVVNEPGGTGGKARIPELLVGGKTGTAQVVGRRFYSASSGKVPKRFEDHAWFVALAPVEEPKIVVAVYCEHGGHGGSAAAPLAREIIRAYLLPNQQEQPQPVMLPAEETEEAD
ncbi:MAG: penicillin-binding protein 2 [Desulfobacterota bacterium]|nr:penicillin-binding protein 2 [Thermodesulfobacteriota bacterium]